MIVGTDKNKIKVRIKNFYPQKEQINVFGDGNASDKILSILIKQDY